MNPHHYERVLQFSGNSNQALSICQENAQNKMVKKSESVIYISQLAQVFIHVFNLFTYAFLREKI